MKGSPQSLALLLLTLVLLHEIHCQDDTDDYKSTRLKSELELIDWDLEDYCEDLSTMKKEILLHKKLHKNKANFEVRYGSYLKNQTKKLLTYSQDDVSSDFFRNYSVLIKPGDALLSKDDWKALVNFSNSNEELIRNVRINYTDTDSNDVRKLGQHDYLNLLSTTRNLSVLRNAWTEWQLQVSRYQEKFPATLQLLPKAASSSEQYDTRAYWELLSDYENGYATALSSWKEIKPLYTKLYDFVLTRLNNYYKENFTEIPVFLLGSNFGEDWSNVADIILPHPQIYHDFKAELLDKTVQDVYKLSESVLKSVGSNKVKWSLNVLNSSVCINDVLYYCASRRAEIISCEGLDWMSYFKSHENILEIGSTATDYTSLPRERLRYSIIDDAIVEFGSVFAVHNLPYYGLLEEDIFTGNENASNDRLSALLLLALRVLPKLPFYLAADTWRLEELEKPSGGMNRSWWEMRKKYQGISGVSNAEADYMSDTFMTTNKPYLSKFMGTLLAFQILNYHQINVFDEPDNIAERLGEETDFRATIKERPSKAPLEVLSYNYGFDAIDHYQLVDFFRPLEEYFDSAPVEQAPVIKKPKKPKRVEVPPPDVAAPETKTTPQVPTPQEIPVQNDQDVAAAAVTLRRGDVEVVTASTKSTETNAAVESSYSGGIYIAITVGACLLIALSVFVFKRVVRMRKTPRTNNRRFEA